MLLRALAFELSGTEVLSTMIINGAKLDQWISLKPKVPKQRFYPFELDERGIEYFLGLCKEYWFLRYQEARFIRISQFD